MANEHEQEGAGSQPEPSNDGPFVIGIRQIIMTLLDSGFPSSSNGMKDSSNP
jgi:hypothetical protein